jgi:hypothetical protein
MKLFKNEDFSFTLQAIQLIESLIYTEEDFRDFLRRIHQRTVEKKLESSVEGFIKSLVLDTEEQDRITKEVTHIITQQRFPKDLTLENLQAVFQVFDTSVYNEDIEEEEINRTKSNYLQIWALGNLAQWNEQIREKTISLDLSDNELTCLPDSIGYLKNLTYLNLGYNQLTSLPDNITRLDRKSHKSYNTRFV